MDKQDARKLEHAARYELRKQVIRLIGEAEIERREVWDDKITLLNS